MKGGLLTFVLGASLFLWLSSRAQEIPQRDYGHMRVSEEIGIKGPIYSLDFYVSIFNSCPRIVAGTLLKVEETRRVGSTVHYRLYLLVDKVISWNRGVCLAGTEPVAGDTLRMRTSTHAWRAAAHREGAADVQLAPGARYLVANRDAFSDMPVDCLARDFFLECIADVDSSGLVAFDHFVYDDYVQPKRIERSLVPLSDFESTWQD